MAWVQLGEAGLEGVDAVLHERMRMAVMGCASEAHSHRPATGFAADEHLSGGEEFARPMHARESCTELKGKNAGAEAPASADRGGDVKRGEAGNSMTTVDIIDLARLPTIGRDMATARRAEPHGSAVVISLAMYRAQRRAVLGLGEHVTATHSLWRR
jgi:hypothetical protein